MDMSDFHVFEENTLQIQSLPGNDRCVDCGAAGPSWGSLGFGVVVCLECAGVHTVQCIVRSVTSANLISYIVRIS